MTMMWDSQTRRVSMLSAMVLAAVGAGGCASQPHSRATIDPQADQALRRMSALLGHARSFRFQSVATMDELAETGEMVQLSRESLVVVLRPGSIFAESRRGQEVWTLWYHEKELTLLNRTANTYGAAGVPGRIDDMLDAAARQYGLTMPLADFLYSNPYEILTARALAGRYVGQVELDGARCDQVLFTQNTVDWQMWIDSGPQPVPRKIVIDYKRLAGRPQFSAVLSHWDFAAPAGPAQFRAEVPKDAKRLEIKALLGRSEGTQPRG
jgi:hypothetical protein